MRTIYQKLEDLLKSDEPLNVKFIRLGEKSNMFEYCKANDVASFGFGTENLLDLCNELRDIKTRDEAEKELKEKLKVENNKSIFGQISAFFKDDGTTLWVTSFDRKLFFNFSDGESAFSNDYTDKKGAKRNIVFKGMLYEWCSLDVEKNPLNHTYLNGGIKKTFGYQGTICDFSNKDISFGEGDNVVTVNYAKLLINRILCKESESRIETKKAYEGLLNHLQVLIRTFDPKDFELLVELVVSRAGFKRVGIAGKTEEFIDLELKHPLTGDNLVVQVKSSTNQQDFKDWVDDFNKRYESTSYKAIYAYHSLANRQEKLEINKKSRVEVWDAEKIAKLALDNGLADWIIITAPI